MGKAEEALRARKWQEKGGWVEVNGKWMRPERAVAYRNLGNQSIFTTLPVQGSSTQSLPSPQMPQWLHALQPQNQLQLTSPMASSSLHEYPTQLPRPAGVTTGQVPFHIFPKKSFEQPSQRKLERIQRNNANILQYQPPKPATIDGSIPANKGRSNPSPKPPSMLTNRSTSVVKDSIDVSSKPPPILARGSTSVDKDAIDISSKPPPTPAGGSAPIDKGDGSEKSSLAYTDSAIPALQSSTLDLLDDVIKQGQAHTRSSGFRLADVEFSGSLFDQFRPPKWYSAKIFQLLRGTSTVPPGTIVCVSDERFHPTKDTTDIVIVHNQNASHWIVLHIMLAGHNLVYYDSMMPEGSKANTDIVNWVSEKVTRRLGRVWKPSSVRVHRDMAQGMGDGSSCGPLAWREVELITGLACVPPENESPAEIRLRHAKQVVDALIKLSKPIPEANPYATDSGALMFHSDAEEPLPSVAQLLRDCPKRERERAAHDFPKPTLTTEPILGEKGARTVKELRSWTKGYVSGKDKSHCHPTGKGLEDGRTKRNKYRQPAGASGDSPVPKKRKTSTTANGPEEHYASHENLGSNCEELTDDSKPRPHTKRNSRWGARPRYTKEDTDYIWAQAKLGTPWDEIAKKLGRDSFNVVRKYNQLYRDQMESNGKKTRTRGLDRCDSDRARKRVVKLTRTGIAFGKRKRDPNVSYDKSHHILDEFLDPGNPPASDSSDSSDYWQPSEPVVDRHERELTDLEYVMDLDDDDVCEVFSNLAKNYRSHG